MIFLREAEDPGLADFEFREQLLEALNGRCHIRSRCFGEFDLTGKQFEVLSFDQQVNLKVVVRPSIVQTRPLSMEQECLDGFLDAVGFEQCSGEGAVEHVSFGINAGQITREAAVQKISFRGFRDALSEVLVVGRE